MIKLLVELLLLLIGLKLKNKIKTKLGSDGTMLVDDIEVSKKLIEAVIDFGKKRELSFIEGPVGFSNMDKAGLLTHGYQELNTMITWYHNSYQKDHLNNSR